MEALSLPGQNGFRARSLLISKERGKEVWDYHLDVVLVLINVGMDMVLVVQLQDHICYRAASCDEDQ